MKISRRSIKAGCEDVKGNVVVGPYADSIDCIKSAIDCLSKDAIEGDQLAKDSIANLSVVLFDLQG